MLSRHFAMNLLRNLALSPTGSLARRSAAFARKTFVGTWRCCWRLRLRNALKASWSEGPVSRSASSWPLAAIRGAMGCGHWDERVRRGQAAPRRQSDGCGLPCAKTGLPCDGRSVRHRHRLPPGNSQRHSSSRAALAAIHGPSRRPQRLGRRLQRNPHQASGGKALASWASGTKARPTMGR